MTERRLFDILGRGIRLGWLARVVVASCAIGTVACNLGGYPNLGSKLDPLDFAGSDNATAWMRTAVDGHSELLVLGEAVTGEDAGFIFVTMGVDSTGTILAGDYTIRQDEIVLSVVNEYSKTAEFDRPPSQRNGSTRTDFDPPREIVYSAEEIDGRLWLTRAGDTPIAMTEFWDVLAAVDPSTQQGIEMLARFYNLTTVSLQMRIPGFGGAGLLQYTGEPSAFVGVLRGSATIEMLDPFDPLAKILFLDYADYPGIVLDGDQVSSTDMAGDGNLSGTVHFAMTDPREDRFFTVEGELTYDLELTNGRSSGGGYTIRMADDTVWNVSYEAGETLDFRGVLPPS